LKHTIVIQSYSVVRLFSAAVQQFRLTGLSCDIQMQFSLAGKFFIIRAVHKQICSVTRKRKKRFFCIQQNRARVRAMKTLMFYSR